MEPVKRWLKRAILRLGYDVMRVAPPGWYPYYLERLGFCPETVVGVGVGFGTPALYQTFPRAHHVLIEPLAEFEPHLRAIPRRYRGEYHLTALGAGEEERRIQINPVIAGADRFLRATEFLIAEVAVAERFAGGYPFTEFIRALDERAFRLRDILDIGRAENSEMTFVDAVFEKM